MKFMLCIVSILVIAATFFYLPASALVFVSLIPALIYGFWTRRIFLVLISVAVFATTFLLFIAMLQGVTDAWAEMIGMVIYLYQVIYPYQLSLNIIEFMGTGWIWVISLFIFFVLLVGHLIKFNTFKVMIVFSYFIMLFTTFYLIANVFCYLIPPLRDFILNAPVMREILTFMYGVLPFIVLTLILMFLFTIYDYRERRVHSKDARGLKKQMGPRTMTLMKYGAILALILLALCVIFIAIY